MTAVVIDGNAIAQEIRAEAAEAVAAFQSRHGIAPGLAVVLVGEDPASAVYVRNKERACREAGILAQTINLPSSASQDEVIAAVRQLNDDPAVHGILVQLPLPSHVDERAVIMSLDPDKDVDGLHPVNVGRLVQGEPLFVPCTPWGIQEMLVRSGHSPEGKHVVVCGRSDIVGKPVAMLLGAEAGGSQRHRDHVPHGHPGPRGRDAFGGHPGGGHRAGGGRDRGHGERGRGGHRRGHQPR